MSKLQYRYGRSAEQSAHKHPHASYTNCHRKVTPDMLLGRIAMSRVRCGLQMRRDLYVSVGRDCEPC